MTEKRFNNSEKAAGEMAVRTMSEKAQNLYNNSDPFFAYEYREDGKKLYAYSGAFGEDAGLTFDEMEQALEEIWDEVNEDE